MSMRGVQAVFKWIDRLGRGGRKPVIGQKPVNFLFIVFVQIAL